MRRSALGVVVWLLALNALVKPAWLLAENSVQNHLGHTRFGVFAAVWQLVFICAALLDVGTTLAATRQAAANQSPENEQQLRATLGLRLLLAVVFALVVPLAAWLLDFTQTQWYLVGYLGAYHLGIGTLLFTRALHQGRQRFYLDGLLGVLDKLLLLVVVYVIVLRALPSERLYAQWAVVSLIVPIALGVGVLARRGPWLRPRIEKNAIRRALIVALPFAAMAALVALNERMTTLVLERSVGSQEAGYYAAAYRWIAAAQMYLWTVAPVYFARFAQVRHQPEAVPLREGYYLLALPVLAVATVLVTHSEIPIRLLTNSAPAEQAQIAQLLQLLALGLVPLALATPLGTYSSATGQAGRLARVLVPATLVHGVVLAVAVQGQWQQAATAYSVFQLLAAGLYTWVFIRKTNNSLPLKWMAQSVAATALGVLASYLLKKTEFHWIWSAGTGAAVVMLLGGGAGLIQKLVKRKQPLR